MQHSTGLTELSISNLSKKWSGKLSLCWFFLLLVLLISQYWKFPAAYLNNIYYRRNIIFIFNGLSNFYRSIVVFHFVQFRDGPTTPKCFGKYRIIIPLAIFDKIFKRFALHIIHKTPWNKFRIKRCFTILNSWVWWCFTTDLYCKKYLAGIKTESACKCRQYCDHTNGRSMGLLLSLQDKCISPLGALNEKKDARYHLQSISGISVSLSLKKSYSSFTS